METNYKELIKWIRTGCDQNKSKLITKLRISYNQLTTLPESIGLLTNLNELYCDNNNLTTLPESIGLLTNLNKLYCDNNNLTTLPESIELLTNLTVFACCGNKLTSLPKSISSLTNLNVLNCSVNCLTTLPESIGNLTNLTALYCCGNKLTSLPKSIEILKNLTYLSCHNNNLTTLPTSIEAFTKLRVLDCSFNSLTSLPVSVGNLTNLTGLYCGNNSLTTLPTTIELLTNLIELYCHNNQLTTLPAELGNCRRLRYLDCSNNPIEFIPVNIQRLLDRIENHQGIYGDSQNVHNHDIQQSISKSVYSLLNDSLMRQPLIKNNTIDNILKSSLTDKTKQALIEYSEDIAVHTVLNISFKELLDYVWQRIENHKDKENILRILEDEMSDAECKCFTGRISRLVNCLNGFYDDIRVEIGAKEQIGNIIILIKNKLIDQGKYTVAAHKEEVRAALKERGYPDEQINIWLDYIE